MNFFLLNILLALAWVALTAEFTPQNFGEGFILGYVMLWLARPAIGASPYTRKIPVVIRFALAFMWDLLTASLRVAWEVITPRPRMRPGVVAVPLDVQSSLAIILVANLITLTPGTLSLDVSQDRAVLYVHAMYVDDIDEFRREIKEGVERRVKELLET